MKLAIFASGIGTTGEILFKYASVVLTNNPQAGVIERARSAGIPVEIVERSGLDLESYGEKIIESLSKYNFDFISQNGWELTTPSNVCQKYAGKITNNHPAPLDPGHPDFGGKGMKGLAVHIAVLNFFQKVNRPFNSEICIHLVTEELDKGGLLAYGPVVILEDDTPLSLLNRVKKVEKRLIEQFWEKVKRDGKLVPFVRTERVLRPEEFGILEQAKADAIAQSMKG